ncbi:MAG: ring-1,2-phenylacetyl-CoA epoxidase subunit PaaE [Cyclobacteriaceae bacterium]|jgi:ring-1,2-phenylacetyl-CoA epoxidase subunit PaaE
MAFGLFKKKKKVQDDNRYSTLTIKEVVHIAKDAVNLVFDRPNGKFEYEPGQFITIIDTVNGEKLRRAYSLCTTPYLDKFPAVTIKRVPDGKMSNHINDHFKAGQKVEIMDPMGIFTIKYSSDTVRKAIFWGGGSGITPLYGMLRSVLNKELFSKVALVYGNREEDYIVFKNELNALKEEYGSRFQLIHILDNDPNGLTHHHGIPTPEMIGDIFEEIGFGEKAEHYICGPEPMMNVVLNGLDKLNIASELIKKESFEAGKKTSEPATDEKPKKLTSSMVTIELDGEEHTIEVAANESILDAGLDKDLDMPYSCQSGLCTACRGKCVEGKISLDDAEGISQDEIDEGYVLLCVGKPLTEKVKVIVG